MNLNGIYIIAKNTYIEVIRDRILYGLLVFAVLLIGLSLILGQLTFAEQARITANFGFAAIHISAVILSIFVGSTLVSREIEKKTILTLLARPVSRTQFIVGKALGLMSVIFMAITLLSIVLIGLFYAMGLNINLSFLIGLYGIFLEAAVLLSFTIFFGSFASPMMAVSFSIGIFLIGHWLDSLKFFSEKGASASFVYFAKGVQIALPNLELFNWRSLFIYSETIPFRNVGISSVYGGAWCLFLITIAAVILRRRDLG